MAGSHPQCPNNLIIIILIREGRGKRKEERGKRKMRRRKKKERKRKRKI